IPAPTADEHSITYERISLSKFPKKSFSTATGVSNNVGGVKYFWGALIRALRRAPFRSRWSFCFCFCSANQGSPRNRFQVRNSVRPMHLFGHTLDHDYYFELPPEGERDTQSITRCSTAHHRLFRVVPRANRTFSTARNSIPSAPSNTSKPRVCAPSRPWQSSVLAASPGESTYFATPGRCARQLAPPARAGNATARCLVS